MGIRGVRGVWEVYGIIWGCRNGPPHGILTNKKFDTNSQTKFTTGPNITNRTNMSIQHIITLLEFCLKIHTSSSKVSIMTRSRVLP